MKIDINLTEVLSEIYIVDSDTIVYSSNIYLKEKYSFKLVFLRIYEILHGRQKKQKV